MNTNVVSFKGTGTEKIIYGWLLLAVFSLVFAGIFALLVALARTPGAQEMLPLGKDYIYVALVGHVVLAVVIWFLAFEGFLWTYTSSTALPRGVASRILAWASLALSYSGMALVVASAVFGLGPAELANYVPVLVTPVFYAGLILFGAGIILTLINAAAGIVMAKGGTGNPLKGDGGGEIPPRSLPVETFGMAVAGAAAVSATACFAFSGYFQFATGKAFFDAERFFWGGGHMLQFVNTISMITVWIYLSRLSLGSSPLGPRLAKALFASYLLFIIPAPFIYLLHDTSTQAHKDAFTFIMRWGLGPATGVFILAILMRIFSSRGRDWSNPAFSSLCLSIATFLIGGAIALDISGVNTKIPAHYHCVIGAVTIAFMGFFYELMPLLKKEIYSKKMATVQPYLYTAGVLFFAAGLYIAGAHGVARKTYGAAQNLDNTWKLVSMSVMGLGGLVAIIGGILFVVNALLTLLGKTKTVVSGDAAQAPDRSIRGQA